MSSPAAYLLESKLLFNSTISHACQGERFVSCDLKYFSWKIQSQEQSILEHIQNISQQTSETNTSLMDSLQQMDMST